MKAKFSLDGKRVWIAGSHGMVGSALTRLLQPRGVELIEPSGPRLDLRRQSETEAFLMAAKPDAVFMAAARVGGVLANSTRPAEFLYDNLMIQTNVLHAAQQAGVKKLLFLGSTCIYPRDAAQPIAEEALLTGPLEATNEWYAIAKIAGIKLCQALRDEHGADFISAMPTNLYGPNDNFDLTASHVLPALIRKIYEATQRGDSEVVIWGSGTPRRELMHVDDLAEGLVFLMESYSERGHINVGTGVDCSITELAELVAEIAGYSGRFVYDKSKPEGTPRKCTDVTRLNQLGFKARINLKDGVRATYRWYAEHALPLDA